jgi:glycerol uptake facilitator-like aquaporin
MKDRSLVWIAALVGATAAVLLLTGCATPKIGFGYDFLNKRITMTVEPQYRDGKTVVAPSR